MNVISAEFVLNYIHYIIFFIFILIFVAMMVFISVNFKLVKIKQRYQKMMRGMNEANLETLLVAHIEEVRRATAKIDALSADYQRLEAVSKNCIQKLGVVRFNAFPDMGSDLSFAVALLDANDNGVVISSIFCRHETCSYSKPIVGGASTYLLTQEEKEALAQACQKKMSVRQDF